MTALPEVTVLMAVRNGEPYIDAAVRSILEQTYPHVRLLVVNDASTDRTAEIVASFADPRIQILTLDTNVGQTAALNRGLAKIRTDWMARMDADDYSAPRRIELQIKKAMTDSSIGCVGAFAWTFSNDPSDRLSIIEKPVTADAIKAALLWSTPIIHGSILVRTKTMIEAGGYNEKYRYSADLDLYDRLIVRCKVVNVDEPLLGIRRHPGQDSHSPKAIRESIDILNRRLSSGRYSRDEHAVVRAAKHLHEGLCSMLEERYGDTAIHVLRAFCASPTLTMRHVVDRLRRA